jgi:hypothetical protein
MMMTLFKKIPIPFEEKQYEIRVLYDESTVNVVAFLHNHPLNGFRHQVKISKRVDIRGTLEMNAAADLIEICKKDILEKRWQKWERIIQENKKAR